MCLIVKDRSWLVLLFRVLSSMHHIKPHPYRSTVWQYSPKKYSEGPQDPSDPPPLCLLTQASAGESLLDLLLVFMVFPTLRRCVDLLVLSCSPGLLISCLLLSPLRCGAVRWRLFSEARTSSSRRRKQRMGAPHRRGSGSAPPHASLTGMHH